MNDGPTFTPREDLGGSPQVSPQLVLVGPLGPCLGGGSHLPITQRSTSTRGSHSVPSASLSVTCQFPPNEPAFIHLRPTRVSLSLSKKYKPQAHTKPHFSLVERAASSLPASPQSQTSGCCFHALAPPHPPPLQPGCFCFTQLFLILFKVLNGNFSPQILGPFCPKFP